MATKFEWKCEYSSLLVCSFVLFDKLIIQYDFFFYENHTRYIYFKKIHSTIFIIFQKLDLMQIQNIWKKRINNENNKKKVTQIWSIEFCL